MEIVCFDTLPSTQHYLLEALEQGSLEAPVAVLARVQSAGVGSRENGWEGAVGNLFASIALPIAQLPSDLKLPSASIYFSFVMKQLLNELGYDVWLKWPNDFYFHDAKIGGTMTQKVGEVVVCGMGINLQNAPDGYGSLESSVEAEGLLRGYLQKLLAVPSWQEVFSEYAVEFERSRAFSTHIHSTQTSLKASLLDATLCEDGSLKIKGRRVYSLR